MNRSFKHHYVPVWYQKGFMIENQTAYHRLDLDPEVINIKPTGEPVKRKDLETKGPGKFFFEVDLYTTKYFGIDNDEIEKRLFGKIDAQGSLALSALVSKHWMKELHPHYINFFEYMDAQKIRTPKGLHWILSILKPSDYNDLLFKMQHIRRIHCTMWVEATMEIVSAEDSDVKFIVSDTPVTTYNSACDLTSKHCTFPYDPGIELIGTRTIFPIDLDHCVILTNLEYTKNPKEADRMKLRTNARFFDDTIANYTDIHRGRKLNRESVLGINYILKNRANKYIAAANKEWLYPEKYITVNKWSDLDSILISDKFKSMGYPGEIFIGGENGKLLMTQDEFGRKPKTKEEWAKKEKHAQNLTKHVEMLLAKEKKSNKT